MLKKFCSGLLIVSVVGLFSGCSDDSNKPQVNKPIVIEDTKTAAGTHAKLYSDDLKITQDEFIAVYNDVLKNLSRTEGQNYDNLNITLDEPKSVEQTQNGATHFYSGERGIISIFRNDNDADKICAAMLTAKTNYNLPDLVEEITALTQAATQKERNFQNVMNFLQDSLKSKTSAATNIDGLVVSYNSTGNFLTIISEDAKAGNGFERIVDNVITSAKMGGYWRK